MKKYSGYIVAMIIAVLTALIILPANASVEEVREATLDHFDLSQGTFFLKDEFGHLWEFELLNGNYHIGDRHILHIPAEGDPWYELIEDAMSLTDVLQIIAGLGIASIGGGTVFAATAKCDRHWQ